MTRLIRAAAWALVLFGPLTANAFGCEAGGPVVTAYYYPAPVVYAEPAPAIQYVPAPVCATEAPVCSPAAPPACAPGTYAVPTPAPPSASPATPPATPGKPIPKVTESQSYYNAYAASPSSANKPERERFQVDFWNLSGQELILQVSGQTYVLIPGNKVQLDLGRQFVWQIAGREPQAETIPANESGVEIVVRR